jgi:hypothetical protein
MSIAAMEIDAMSPIHPILKISQPANAYYPVLKDHEFKCDGYLVPDP